MHFWCDSKTTINYLKNETTNFGIYIAHKVNEMRRSSSIEDWYYVPIKLNVADDLTRFTGFQTLTNQSRWCIGPEFLLQDNIKSVHLNLTKTERIKPSVQLESNADKITNKEQDRIDTSIPYSKSDIQKQHILMCINWYHYSSFIILIRHLSWILKPIFDEGLIKVGGRIRHANC